MDVKPGYKQTELGLIPKEWKIAELDTLGSVIDGDRGTNYPSSKDFSESGHCLFLNAGNVTKDGFRFSKCVFITAEKDGQLGKGHLKRNDIVLTTRGTVGNLAYFDAAVLFEHIRINSGMVILRNESSDLNTSFLYAFLQSHYGQSQIERLSFGSAQPQLTVKGISKLRIITPCLAEQQAIAEALSDVDALISALDRLITKKRAIKQGAMQELLTGRRRLPGFDGEWEVRHLGSILQLRYGKSQRGITISGGDYPVLATSGEFGRTNRILYDRPSVIIGRKGTIDAPLYVDTPFWAIDTTYYSEISELAHPKYLYYLFTTFDWYAYNEASGVPSLNAKTVHSIEASLPPILEQTAIATALSDMDAEIAALERRRDKTKLLKQGMMQELLTGRIRLV
jgi:type I restriction enzyme S subunit